MKTEEKKKPPVYKQIICWCDPEEEIKTVKGYVKAKNWMKKELERIKTGIVIVSAELITRNEKTIADGKFKYGKITDGNIAVFGWVQELEEKESLI